MVYHGKKKKKVPDYSTKDVKILRNKQQDIQVNPISDNINNTFSK